MYIIVKRIVIITLLLTVIFSMAHLSDDTLLLNSPTSEELFASLEVLKDRKDEIAEIINKHLNRDPEEEYNKLFNDEIRHTFIIEFTQEEFDGWINDMEAYHDLYGNYKSNEYHKVRVIYIADEDIQVINDVGIRTKGNIYSRRLPIDQNGNVQEVHFMLKFNNTFDYAETDAKYEELKTREFLGIEQLLFKWNNTFDPSFANEVYSYQMFRDVGVVVPNASFAEVQIVIDGEVKMKSFYNIFEHYDEEFIRRNFNEDGDDTVGDLYKGQWSGTLEPITSSTMYGVRNWESDYRPLYSKETNKDIDDFQSLIDFSYGINDPNIAARKLFFIQHFNVDSFIRAMAMNVLLGNPDDYRGNGNNFYYYFDPTGYMTYIPYDYDNSMGSGWMAEPAFQNYTLGNDIYTWGWFDWNTFDIPLWNNLIYYEDIQILYENYLEEFIVSGTYSEESYLEMFDTIDALYGDDFNLLYDKTYFIETKIERVLEQVEYYRNLRN